MIELVAAGAALASRALLQAADTALLAVSEDELRAAQGTPRRARWVLELKRDPEPTAATLRAAASALLAFAAVACAIWVNGVLARAGIARASMSRASLQLLAGVVAGVIALLLDLAPRSLAAASPLRWSLALAGPTYFVCAIFKPPMQLMLRVFDALLLRQGANARPLEPRHPSPGPERAVMDGCALEATADDRPQADHAEYAHRYSFGATSSLINGSTGPTSPAARPRK